MHISPNFTLAKLCRSDIALHCGIDNTPTDPHIVANLRGYFGVVLVTSGYVTGQTLFVDGGYTAK